MKIAHSLTVLAVLLAGFTFVASSVSDIQLGFGLVLISMALLDLFKK